MAKFPIELTPYDGGEPVEVVADNRDLLVYEKTSKGHSIRPLTEGSVTELYKVAHIAATRQQLFDGTLSEFQQTYDLDESKGDEDPDPTQPDPSPEE